MTKTRKELAESYFLEGYSCSQSIILAFIDLIKIDKEEILKISSPFGGGVGRLREICGSLSGIYIVLGYLYGNPTTDINKKTELYKYVQEIAKKFEKINGFIRCRDLLNIKTKYDSPTPSIRDKQYYLSRPCKNIIGNAAEILDQFIKNHPIN